MRGRRSADRVSRRMPSLMSVSWRSALGVAAAALTALVLAGCGGQEAAVEFGAAEGSTDSVEQVDDLPRPGTPADARFYEAPDGSFTLGVPKRWKRPASSLDLTSAVWYTDTGSAEFDANVNVLTESVPADLTIDKYLELSVENGPSQIEGFAAVDMREVVLANGDRGGRAEYTGEFAGQQFHFLALISLEADLAVIATYTNVEANYQRVVSEIEPYLLTLAVGSDLVRAEQEPEAASPTKVKKKQKKKGKNPGSSAN
jgi:hypothetical protein